MPQTKSIRLNSELVSALQTIKQPNQSYSDVLQSVIQSASTPQTNLVGNTSIIGVGAGIDAYNAYTHVMGWVVDTSKKLISGGNYEVTPTMREQAFDIDPLVNGILTPFLKNIILGDHILETKDNKKYSAMIEEIEDYLLEIKLMKVYRDDFEDLIIKHGHSYRRIDYNRDEEGYIQKLQRLETRAMVTYEDPFDSDIVLYHQSIYAADVFSSTSSSYNSPINSWWIPDGLIINDDAGIEEDGAMELWQQYQTRYGINETSRLRVGDSANIIAMHRVRPGKPAPIDGIIQAIWEKRALFANIPQVMYSVLYPLVQVIQGILYESIDENGTKVMRTTVPLPPEPNDATNNPEKYARENTNYTAYTSALKSNIENLIKYQMEGGKLGTGPDVQLKVIESASTIASSFINVAILQFNEEICQGIGLPYSLLTARGSELATSRAIQDLVNTVYAGQRQEYQDNADWIIEQRFANKKWKYELKDKYGEIEKGTFTFEETKVKFKLSNGDVTDNLKIAQTRLINFQTAEVAKRIGAGLADLQAFFDEIGEGATWDFDNFNVKPDISNPFGSEVPAIGKPALPSDMKVPSVSEQIQSSIIQSFNEHHDEKGLFASGGSGGGGSGAVAGNALVSKDKKDFNSQADGLYKAQGVQDWQGDYMSELQFRGYFGNPQAFEVNKALRGNGKSSNPKVKDTIDKINAGMITNGVTVPPESKLYRAVSGDYATQLRGMAPGSSYTDKGFVSTTGVKKYASRFGDTLMEIKPKKGSNLKALLYKDESEVLLSSGRKFTIMGSKKVGKNHVISVEVE